MKALLEFAYPEDEHKLQHAMRATEYYDALCDIDNILAMPHTKAEMVSQVKTILNEIFEELGE